MMHKAHVLTGVAFVAVTAAATHPTPTAFLLAATSVPGFALFPDIDHPKSMVSSTYGWFTSLFSLLLGHRRETHSFPGIAAFGCVTYAATLWPNFVVSKVWLTALLVLCWASLLRAFKIKGRDADLLPWVIAIPIIWYRPELTHAGFPPYPLSFIPVALVLGMLLHVAGDCLTNSGCPLWWPFSKKRSAFRYKLRPGGKKRSLKTNSPFEHRVVVPLLWVVSIGSTLLWVSDLV